uniref:Uncharacterized protein n=1 Tax=Anguilla anguilla TaxID=7936 RepID=A0A0E9VNK3_ANGAN
MAIMCNVGGVAPSVYFPHLLIAVQSQF